MDEPKVPEKKLAEARALWEIALIYIALGGAARTISGAGDLAAVAVSGFRAGQLLARAYYRLLRAVWSGHAVVDNDEVPGSKTSLSKLYSEFETLAYHSIPKSKHEDVRRRVELAGEDMDAALEGIVPERDEVEQADDRFSTEKDLIEASESVDAEGARDVEVIETDDDEWPSALDIVLEELEEAERHLRDVEAAEKEELEELRKRLVDLAKEEERIERAAQRREERREQRSRQLERKRAMKRRATARSKRAAAVMRAAQAGARQEINSLTSRDRRALGWVRVTHHPTPCAFCLMLASRGIALYKSAASARAAWHENCHCTAEPVFSVEQYMTSELFAKNRALHMLWRDVASGKGDGLKAWRKHFRAAFANGKNLAGLLADERRKHTPPSQEDTNA